MYGYQSQRQPKKGLNWLAIFKKTFIIIINYYCIVCVGDSHAMLPVWRSEDNSVEPVLSTFI